MQVFNTIYMPHVDFNNSNSVKFVVFNCQFKGSEGLMDPNRTFLAQMLSLIGLWKNKVSSSKFLLNWSRGFLNKRKNMFELSAFGIFKMIVSGLLNHKWGAFLSPLMFSFSILLFLLSNSFLFFFWVFPSFAFSPFSISLALLFLFLIRIVFVFPFSLEICWASQHCSCIFLLLPVLWQKLSTLVIFDINLH